MRAIDLKPRLTGLLQAAAVVTAVYSVATLTDHLHRYLELFSHFRLQYLAVAAILAVLLLIVRSRAWAILMLAITAINAVPVAGWYLAGPASSEPTGATIKLLLSNVYSGNDDTQQLLDLVAAEDADILFLQEVTDRRNRDLSALREIYRYSLNIPREDNFGIAVLSRHPFVNARVIQSPPFEFPSLVVEIAIDEENVTFMTTHPMPPIGRTGFDGRNEQLESVADAMNSFAGPRVLIGDLNTSMWGNHYDMLVASTGLTNARDGFGVLPTWPTQLPFAMIPIDHCLVSEELRVLDIRTGPNIGSDHLPLIVELDLQD